MINFMEEIEEQNRILKRNSLITKIIQIIGTATIFVIILIALVKKLN